MTGRLKHLFILILVAMAFPVGAIANADGKIESLLKYVRDLQGATFVRNGSEHNAVEAEAHLRMKWVKQTEKIHSAEDFIELCATKSYLSGKAYTIKLDDGTVLPCADVLKSELQRIRSG